MIKKLKLKSEHLHCIPRAIISAAPRAPRNAAYHKTMRAQCGTARLIDFATFQIPRAAQCIAGCSCGLISCPIVPARFS